MNGAKDCRDVSINILLVPSERRLYGLLTAQTLTISFILVPELQDLALHIFHLVLVSKLHSK